MIDVEISGEEIDLFKLLKLAGLVSNGAEAKAAIAEGQVVLNGKTETRKRKKVTSGDVVQFGDRELRISGDKSPA